MGTTAAGTAVARKLDSVEALSAELREHTLLEAAQANELPSLVQAAGRDVNRLTQELLRRGWLTPWQAGQVLAGRAAQLSFGPYLLTDRLGEGGAGQVFQARHRRMRRRVALKLIRPEVLQDAELVARFEREIQVASRLSHPNVIHAYDAGTVGATRFLALEYAEGIDLDRLLKQSGPLPVERACDYIRQGALGLHHAFEHGLVHRDVKPSNFLLVQGQAKAEVPGYEDSAPAIPSPGPTPWGLVKLLDLGLARLQRKVDGEKTRLLTTVGSVLGTADFLAPEQALDFHRADTRSDIYGLGCTFYCLLAGQPPFAGKSFAQKLMCHQQAPPPPLEQFRQDVPSKVREILQKMLAKRPDDRYQTPAEVAGELAECLGLHQLPATAVATGRFAAAARAPLSTATDRTMILTGPQRPAPRRRRLLWLPVAGGAGLLALGLLLLLTGGSQRRESAGAVKPTYAFTHRALAATSAKTGLPTTARAVLPVLPDAERLVVLAQSSDGWRYIAAPEVAALGIAQCKAPDFDDAKWAIGKAPLGYGEKEIEKRGGTTVGQRNVPFLFRRSFDLPADLLQRGEAGFRVCIASDDSAIVYLNGELLDDDPSRGHDFRYWNRTVETPAKLFRPGRNVLAAYVKNYNGSSDLYWDIEITLAGALPPGK